MPATEPSSGGVVAGPEPAVADTDAPSLFTRGDVAPGGAPGDTPLPPVGTSTVTPPPPAAVLPDADFWGEKEVEKARRTATRQVPAVTVDASTPPASGATAEGDERDGGRGYEARKVRRIIRHVSPWSVFKVSLLFNVCLWAILLVAGVLLWNVAQRTGVITNLEKFYAKSTGEQFHEIDGRGVFRSFAMVGAVLTIALTGLFVLMSVLFNLISDLVGGIRVSVIELEHRRPRRR